MSSSQLRHQIQRFFSSEIRSAILVFTLVAITLAVYAPVKQYPFIHIDDYGYVANNFHIQHLSWDTVTWSFTTFHYANWDPLTWLSHALDIHLFGLDAGRHHEISLLFHVLNALLLFWLLLKATGYEWRSFAVAALFALHPVNVEPVVWIAERKTVLSMCFFLLALMAYRWYAQRPAVARYLVVGLLFAMGLMSKPQVITLPFVLLLWDYWPLGRMFSPSSASLLQGVRTEGVIPGKSLTWLLLEKVPLLALSAGSAFLTMKAQWVNSTLGGLNSYSFAVRFGNATLGYVRYLGHAVWPMNLSFFYPHAHTSPPILQFTAAFLLLLAITGFALANHSRRYFLVGWLWFLGTLVPMVELVQVGNHAMADRYAYVPYVGLFIASCWGIADWAVRWRLARMFAAAGTVAVLILLALTTQRQISYWSNDLNLWIHSAAAIKNNSMAEEMVGENLLQSGDSDGSMVHFRKAAAMDPLFPYPHLHIGIYEENHHHPQQAIEEFQQVIQLTQSAPDHMPVLRSNAFAHMSFAYNQLGKYAEQQKYLSLAGQQASKDNPDIEP